MYLKFIHESLTEDWGIIQGGTDNEALDKWLTIFSTIELDRKVQVDLMLLAQAGLAGRAEANEIMWDILSVWALKPEY